MDSKISTAARKRKIGAGTDRSGKRDVGFRFSRKDAAEKARDRIKKIPGVTASVKKVAI